MTPRNIGQTIQSSYTLPPDGRRYARRRLAFSRLLFTYASIMAACILVHIHLLLCTDSATSYDLSTSVPLACTCVNFKLSDHFLGDDGIQKLTWMSSVCDNSSLKIISSWPALETIDSANCCYYCSAFMMHIHQTNTK